MPLRHGQSPLTNVCAVGTNLGHAIEYRAGMIDSLDRIYSVDNIQNGDFIWCTGQNEPPPMPRCELTNLPFTSCCMILLRYPGGTFVIAAIS